VSRPAWLLVLLAMAALLAAALLAAGCRRAPAPPADNEAAIRKRLGQKSTAVLLDEVAKTDFKPPADGRLTEPEVRSYLQVEERSRKIRAVATQGAAPEQGATAELRAAQELGLNPKEMAWVHDRVREARSARLGDLLDRRLAESRRQLVQRWQDEEKRANDPAQKREIERRIADFAREPQSAGPPGAPWVRWNAELLARYEPGRP
jgi:parvulin-like peptidyl-prolyl isomerase